MADLVVSARTRRQRASKIYFVGSSRLNAIQTWGGMTIAIGASMAMLAILGMAWKLVFFIAYGANHRVVR